MIREWMMVLVLVGVVPMMAGCSKTNADNQAKIADTTTTISENTAIQANETNTPKNKKAKIKDPLKVKRADKLKKKPNTNG